MHSKIRYIAHVITAPAAEESSILINKVLPTGENWFVKELPFSADALAIDGWKVTGFRQIEPGYKIVNIK
jgi:hypothetical protein